MTAAPSGRSSRGLRAAALHDRTWRQWRAAPGFHQRLTVTVDPDGDRMDGSWERSSDGVQWTTDFDVTYVRAGKPRSS